MNTVQAYITYQKLNVISTTLCFSTVLFGFNRPKAFYLLMLEVRTYFI